MILLSFELIYNNLRMNLISIFRFTELMIAIKGICNIYPYCASPDDPKFPQMFLMRWNVVKQRFKSTINLEQKLWINSCNAVTDVVTLADLEK